MAYAIWCNINKVGDFTEAILAGLFVCVDHELIPNTEMVTILEADKETCSVEERICKVGVKQDSLAIVTLHDLGHPVGELSHD